MIWRKLFLEFHTDEGGHFALKSMPHEGICFSKREHVFDHLGIDVVSIDGVSGVDQRNGPICSVIHSFTLAVGSDVDEVHTVRGCGGDRGGGRRVSHTVLIW